LCSYGTINFRKRICSRKLGVEVMQTIKVKPRPTTGHNGHRGSRVNSSTLSLPSSLYGVGGHRHAPAALPPGKTQYPLHRRLGGPQGRSRKVLKISPPIGIRSPDRPARSESLYRLSYPGPPLSLQYLPKSMFYGC
jgi:hypothetical protein